MSSIAVGAPGAAAVPVASNNNRSSASKVCLGLARRVYKCGVAVINYVGQATCVGPERKAFLSKWVVSPVVIMGASLFSAMFIKWLGAATLVGKAVGVLGLSLGVNEVLEHVRSMRETILESFHQYSPTVAPPAYETTVANIACQGKEKTLSSTTTAGRGDEGQQTVNHLVVGGQEAQQNTQAPANTVPATAAAAAAAASAIREEEGLPDDLFGESFRTPLRTPQGDRTAQGESAEEESGFVMVTRSASRKKDNDVPVDRREVSSNQTGSEVDLADDLDNLSSDGEYPA